MISKTAAIMHMCLDIEGALNLAPKNNRKSYANHDDGRAMTNNEFRHFLMQSAFEGKRVLPIGDCDNFDYQKGCRGHDVVLLVHDYEFEEGNG